MAVPELLERGIEAIVLTLEAAAAVTVLAGAIFGVAMLRRGLAAARHAFGSAILLALDFTIGADLLKVSTIPDLTGLAIVGGVVLVRIVLTLIMVWEVKSEERAQPVKPGRVPKEKAKDA